VLARLRGEPLVIVAGDSGVGKSSLCRAGVIPAVLEGALGPGEWTAITVVPGRHPLRALAAALDEPALAEQLREAPELLARTLKRRAGARSLLVFLDQLEELMAVGEPDEVAVLDAALAPALEGLPGVCVLATVRADFLARLAELPRLGRDLSQQLYFLRPLPPERLRDVIVGPADAAGIAFESFAIVDELVASAARARDGGLPLLSFALADLWEARDLARGVITSAAVAAVGGVAGALARHADHLIASLSAAQRGHARAILTRLVSAAGTRVRRTAAELGVDGEGSAALDALVSGRLVVAHEPATEAARVASFELAHEVLISGWATLREWLATDAESSALRERLSAATAEWVRLGRRDEDTWQGVRLAEARALPGSLISADERAFLAASRRAAQQRRLVRWGSIGGAIALVALAIAVPRHLASRALARKIASEITAGEAELAAASAQVAARDRHAAAAFAEFDAGRRDDGEDTWELAQAADDAAAHAYLRASGRFETALRLDPQAAVTRSRLGDLLLSRMVHAEVRGDRRLVTELASRLELYDADGSRRARWALPGQVIVRARGALITIEGPEAPAAAAPARRVDPGPITLALKPGSYVLIARVPGRAPVRAPVLVERARTLTQVIDPPPAAGVPRGFVYVPAGEFLYGAESEAVRPFLETVPIHRRSTGEYLIGQTEVTFAEWLEFVDALPPAARAARIPRVESGIGGALAITAGSGGWRLQVRFQRDLLEADWGQPLVIAARARLREQRWQRLPVIGISAEDAVAYARWLASSGRVPGARLCTEEEWERAARGADGRPYPAGERLRAEDAAIDRTHGPQAMGLDEVGSHPRSRSPLGLDDMSGNVWELVRSGPAEFVIRGGAFRHDHRTAHLANRAAMNPAVRDLSVGLRICADLPKRDAR
jgi:formylglycine-generating enzyme required for sulfatase activity